MNYLVSNRAGSHGIIRQCSLCVVNYLMGAKGAPWVFHRLRRVSHIMWVGVDKADFNWLLVPYQQPLLSPFSHNTPNNVSNLQFVHHPLQSSQGPWSYYPYHHSRTQQDVQASQAGFLDKPLSWSSNSISMASFDQSWGWHVQWPILERFVLIFL